MQYWKLNASSSVLANVIGIEHSHLSHVVDSERLDRRIDLQMANTGLTASSNGEKTSGYFAGPCAASAAEAT